MGASGPDGEGSAGELDESEARGRGWAWLRAARAALSGRRAPWLAMLAGVLLGLPSLWGGLVADDHFQQATVRRTPDLGTVALHLFGSPNRPPHARMIEARGLGRAAWYARDDFQVAFCRPLAAATHWLDYRFFDGAPWVMHLHSLAWYAAAIAALTFAHSTMYTRSFLTSMRWLFDTTPYSSNCCVR